VAVEAEKKSGFLASLGMTGFGVAGRCREEKRVPRFARNDRFGAGGRRE
jgi:hypothetical protein